MKKIALLSSLFFISFIALAGETSSNHCNIVDRNGVLSLEVKTSFYQENAGMFALPTSSRSAFHDFPQFSENPRISVSRIQEITRASQCELFSHSMSCVFENNSISMRSNTADEFSLSFNMSSDQNLRAFILENRLCREGPLSGRTVEQTSCRLSGLEYEGQNVLGMAANTTVNSVREGVLNLAVTRIKTTTSLFIDIEILTDYYIRQLPGMLERNNCPRLQTELTRCEKTESSIRFIKSDTDETIFEFPTTGKSSSKVSNILGKLASAGLCHLSAIEQLGSNSPQKSCD